MRKSKYEELPMEFSKPSTHISTPSNRNLFIKFTKSGFVTNLRRDKQGNYYDPLIVKDKDGNVLEKAKVCHLCINKMACQVLHNDFCEGQSFHPSFEIIPKFKKIGDASQFASSMGYKYSYIAAMIERIRNGEEMYDKIVIPKKDGDKRIIYSPEIHLKCLQKAILEFLYTQLKFPKYVVGFVPGKNTMDHARFHLNKKICIKMDIKDFFPSIYASSIYLNLCKRLPDHVAMIITNLCTYKGHAAQGIPTSPCLANMCFDSVDKDLISLCKRNDMTYSRYADDMVFSTNSDINPDEFIKKAYKIINQKGYRINSKKTRIMKDGKTKKICGIIVSDRLNLPKENRKKIRAIVHNSLDNGIENECGSDELSFIMFVEGYLSYIKPINPKLYGELYVKWKKAKDNYLQNCA